MEDFQKKGSRPVCMFSFLLGNIALPDRIRYQIWIPNPDPNLQTQLNPDPVQVRIRRRNTITNGILCSYHCRYHIYS
jgi:hypothetical protein